MPAAAAEFHREYLVRLPLPLAQLYSRAFNAKEARARHDNAFYLFESIIKLAAAPSIAAYLAEVQHGAPRVAALDRLLAQLALPSLGQWVAMLRELARHFGGRADAAAHPLGHLWGQLEPKRRDLSAILALYRRIKNGPDGAAAGDQSCSLLDLLDGLVQYRNGVFGHGASRFDAFYEQEMGPLLLPAASELLAEGVWDLLGPRGSRLVYLTELRSVDEGHVQIGLMELVGRESERMAPQELSTDESAGLTPNCVAVLWPGRRVPLRLDPLLVFRGTELAEEVLFLNRDRNGRQAEYLSYTTGRTERDRSMGPALAKLLSQVTGREISESELQRFGEQSLAETPSVEALFGPGPPTVNQVGDYEILAEIGRGGMGVVYLARQLSLGRLVALKMLPADLAADEVALARFRREMRALGRCEHPHIVKVLSNGTLPDGRLYYTMEYVPGADLEMTWRELAGPNRHGAASSLGGTTWSRAVLTASHRQREAAARHAAGSSSGGGDRSSQSTGDATPGLVPSTDAAAPAPSVAVPDLPLPPLPELPSAENDPGGYARRVATLIRDAALALQTVHEQGIVHRDVKPANLMLTADGQRVVLMDFGLAKGQSASLSASKAGGLLGTLRYAAPEQLAAASLRVGPTADVRGLGITLWEMLTRERLFGEAEDERQLAALVHDQDVPRLRSVDPTLDADLEAIVARATERRVTDRIQTAGQLAEYLQLYLDHQPLPIRPPSAAELLRRWVREHKGLVGSAAVAAAAILLTVTIAFISITAAKNEAVEAKNRAIQLASEKTQLADEKAKLAETEKQSRQRADEQSRFALRTLQSVVFDTQSQLEGIPGAQKVRKKLLNAAIAGLEKVARTMDTAPQADHTMVVSHIELGDTFLLVGGDKGSGATDLAHQQFESARQIAQKLVDANPKNAGAERDLAVAYERLGDVNVRLGNVGAARENYENRLKIGQQLAQTAPRNSEAQRGLSIAYERLGDVDLQLGNIAGTRENYEHRLKISQQLAQADPRNPVAQRDLSISYERLGDAILRSGNVPAASENYALGLKIAQQIARADPQNALDQDQLWVSYIKMGDVNLRSGNVPAAREDFALGLKIALPSAQADPQNTAAQRDLAVSYERLGDMNLQLGNIQVARVNYENRLKIGQQLAQADPHSADAQRGLSFSYEKLGDVNLKLGYVATARENYEHRLKIVQQLAQADPHNAEAQRDLSISYNRVDALDRLGNVPAARENYEQGLKIILQLVQADPQNTDVQVDLSISYDKLGEVNLSLGNVPAARENYEKYLKIARQLAQADPKNAIVQADLGDSFLRLGYVEKSVDDYSAAAKWFEQSVAILAKLDQETKFTNQPLYQSWLKSGKWQLQLSNAAPRAIDDLEFALAQPKDMAPVLLAIRGRALAHRGKQADAAATAEKLVALDPKQGDNLYMAAGVYALCSAAIAAKPPADVSADEAPLQERYAARAVELLKQAETTGYFKLASNRIALEYVHNLDPVRGRDDFKKLLAEVMPPPPPPPVSSARTP